MISFFVICEALFKMASWSSFLLNINIFKIYYIELKFYVRTPFFTLQKHNSMALKSGLFTAESTTLS